MIVAHAAYHSEYGLCASRRAWIALGMRAKHWK